MNTFDAAAFLNGLFAGARHAESMPAPALALAPGPASAPKTRATRDRPCGYHDGTTPNVASDREFDTHFDDPRICEGWTRRSWCERLLRLADGCRETHPVRSAELRAWAQTLSVEGELDPCRNQELNYIE